MDEAQVFSKEERNRILSTIQKLEKATDGGQMAVVTLKSLNGISIEEAGIKIADAWKVGNRGKDDGAILIIVPSERQMRLEIGYGWEGSINDARAGDIIRGLKPFFPCGTLRRRRRLRCRAGAEADYRNGSGECAGTAGSGICERQKHIYRLCSGHPDWHCDFFLIRR